jgi:hypothetical protein
LTCPHAADIYHELSAGGELCLLGTARLNPYKLLKVNCFLGLPDLALKPRRMKLKRCL